MNWKPSHALSLGTRVFTLIKAEVKIQFLGEFIRWQTSSPSYRD